MTKKELKEIEDKIVELRVRGKLIDKQLADIKKSIQNMYFIFYQAIVITFWTGLMFEGLVAYASILAINFTGYILLRKIFEVKGSIK